MDTPLLVCIRAGDLGSALLTCMDGLKILADSPLPFDAQPCVVARYKCIKSSVRNIRYLVIVNQSDPPPFFLLLPAGLKISVTMNKCWFVLEQSFFSPPVYANQSKAGGKAEGGLRLGDVVPSPKDLYPILTSGSLPLFTPDMRILTTQFCDFQWDRTREHEGHLTVAGGIPLANTVGATTIGEFMAEFKRTMKNWVSYDTIDMETVQPSKSYINSVLEAEDVKDFIGQQKTPLLNRWTVYVVTGLMIGRVRGTVGDSSSRSRGIGGGPELDVPGVANLKVDAGFNSSSEITKSMQVVGDRVWAVRFAKVHKGLLRPRWMQTEETIGAALDGAWAEEEEVSKVLEREAIAEFRISKTHTNLGEFIFISEAREED